MTEALDEMRARQRAQAAHLVASAPNLLIALQVILLYAPMLDVAGVCDLVQAAITRPTGASQ